MRVYAVEYVVCGGCPNIQSVFSSKEKAIVFSKHLVKKIKDRNHKWVIDSEDKDLWLSENGDRILITDYELDPSFR